MNKHSFGSLISQLLANLLSKFVTQSRIILRDSKDQGFVKVIVSNPNTIESANVDSDGKITITVGKENDHG